jgi:hypothetical protein
MSSNQAMERATDRREDLFLMAVMRKSETPLALVSGRSSLDR